MHGPGIDNVLTLERGGTRWYYLHDGLGSVTELLDETGALSQAYEYDAWGTPTIYDTGHASKNRYLYTGREWEGAVALYYYRARYYSPSLGRFVQPDPAGAVDGPNLYAYVSGKPTFLVDPTGLEELVVRGSRVYWFVERPSWTGIGDGTVEEREIGSLEGGMVHLNDAYGGGCIPLEEAQGIAEGTTYLGDGLSDATITGTIDRALHGDTFADADAGMNVAGEFWDGAYTGAAEGLAVMLDRVTFGQIDELHAAALEIQREAYEDRDWLSQMGYGLGNLGVDALQAHIGARLLGPIIGRALTSLGGAGPWVARAGALGLGYLGARNTVTAFEAGMAGDYDTMIAAGGDALIDFGFAGALLRWSGGRATQLAQAGRTPSIYRLTERGETFLRYETGAQERSRVTPSGGLGPETYAAPASDGVQSDPISYYDLPRPEIGRPFYVEIRPPAGTVVIGPRPVPGAPGNEVVFPFGAAPGSVGPQQPVPPAQ